MKITIEYGIKDKAYFGVTEIREVGEDGAFGLDGLKEKYGRGMIRKVKSIARKYRAILDRANRDSDTKIIGRLEINLYDSGKLREKPDPVTPMSPFC